MTIPMAFVSLQNSVIIAKARIAPWARLKETFVNGIWALFLPVFILGGIYLGVFNATQAAAMSVILALVIEIAIHRELDIDELPELPPLQTVARKLINESVRRIAADYDAVDD